MDFSKILDRTVSVLHGFVAVGMLSYTVYSIASANYAYAMLAFVVGVLNISLAKSAWDGK